MRGSNPRHPRCKHGALPTELIAQAGVPQCHSVEIGTPTLRLGSISRSLKLDRLAAELVRATDKLPARRLAAGDAAQICVFLRQLELHASLVFQFFRLRCHASISFDPNFGGGCQKRGGIDTAKRRQMPVIPDFGSCSTGWRGGLGLRTMPSLAAPETSGGASLI